MDPGLWKMDSGLAAARRFGMTIWDATMMRYSNTSR
jgi:hypothetical protein